jgi:predicted site-specific integrase-resolvase
MSDPFTKAAAPIRLAYRERELADSLGVSVRTLFDWRKRGLPHVMVNKRPLYLADTVAAWLKAQEQADK